ncbi:ABC transporter permease [Galbibacter pacificus]|uniref:ABC transporter permease n=1 Tax=Galbibacter pacificus TaxID=2996052 RepID=A0ABT6FNV8_9FLAO|nr:ABC transporter permease [Galbibacter pacificus]MDG3581474.1 ABC transporter permease [Galbibacter pacificus]MDG3584952.1 ABC transporter permease [Galbibacter pacificus]
MDKLILIIKREYLAKVRNKSFIVLTILSPLIIVAMIALVVYLAKVNSEEKRIVAVLDESPFFAHQFETGAEASFMDFRDIPLQEAIDSVHSLGYYGLLHIPSGNNIDSVAENIQFYTKESPSLDILGSLEGKISARVREEKLSTLQITPQVINALDKNYEMNIVNFSGEKNVKGISEFKAFIGGGFGYLIMMFIIIYGAFVMRSVIEEKTTRIIEVIISSVKPFQLMLGKIIGTSLAGITQFVIWIVSAGILTYVVLSVMGIEIDTMHSRANISPEAMHTLEASASQDTIQLYVNELVKIPWGTLIVSFLLYFSLGYLIYSSIYAAIGAAVDNETDTQQFMFPVITPLMLAIYVGFFSVFENPNGPIAVAFSLFPLTSPIVMMMRLPGGVGGAGVPWWQLITSILLLILTFLFIVWLAAKIYRVGILMYGKKPSYKEIYRWLKYK